MEILHALLIVYPVKITTEFLVTTRLFFLSFKADYTVLPVGSFKTHLIEQPRALS